MKRQNYYPSRIADQVSWLANFYSKLPLHGPTCGVSAGEVTAAVNDAQWCHYVLGLWLATVRAFGPSTTDAVDDVLTGDPTGGAITLPTFTAPALPAGVAAQIPGALDRLFALIVQMKANPGCTEAIQTDLGIVGPEETEKSAPKFRSEVLDGAPQTVKLVFFKYGHMGVHIESRRGGGGWEFLAIDTENPYLDERPLLVATQPEVREYRMRFWDKGTPNGDWTPVQKVTVGP